MRVFSLRTLREFWEQHPDAETPLRAWHRLALKANWQTLAEVRSEISNADAVHTRSGVLTVFNIGGNKYRLIVRMRYEFQRIFIRAILTHEEYDEGKWKEQ